MSTTTRDALVAGLRALADDIEASSAPLPTHPPSAQWLIFGDEDQKQTASSVIRSLGGRWEKGRRMGDGILFDFERDYGGGVRAQVVVDRPEVCVRRVVGTETVETPAVEARPATTVEREIVEWDCEPILGESVAS